MNITEQDIKDIYDKLKEIEISLVRIEDKLESEKNNLETIKKQIYGNGKSGLLDRINDLEKFEAKVIAIAISGTFIANIVARLLLR